MINIWIDEMTPCLKDAMSGLMQRYNESLALTPGPILPNDLPRVTVDYRSLLSYAKQKGVEPSELSDTEKEQFIIKKDSQEQSA